MGLLIRVVGGGSGCLVLFHGEWGALQRLNTEPDRKSTPTLTPPTQSQDVMFVSKNAIFQPPKAIRGGVPVCFPQFGQLGPLGQHGFARNTAFEVVDSSDSSVTLVSGHCALLCALLHKHLQVCIALGDQPPTGNRPNHPNHPTSPHPTAVDRHRQGGCALPASL